MKKEAKNTKVGIIGMGPVGMILAVKLQEAGCDVAICVRNEVKRNKIKREGIVLENVIESTTKFEKVYSSIEEMAELDLDYLVFALKTYQMDAALKQAAYLDTNKVSVIAAQNGIDVEEKLINAFGEEKCIRMIVNYAGNLISPNTVKVTFFMGPNYLGSVSDMRTEETEKLAGYLTASDLDTKAVDSFEILKRSWEKTILNSSLSALCGVGRLTMAETMSDSDTVELIEQTIQEAVEVAESEKIRFSDDFIRKCMRYLKRGGDHFPSLAIDLMNNRQTEIDYFNGKIVEYGRKHYVKTSLNLAFTNMVKAMTNKNVSSKLPGAFGEHSKKIIDKGLVNTSKPLITYQKENCFLGIDLGSAFTKLTVIDKSGAPVFRHYLPTISSDRDALQQLLQAVHSHFNIKYSCATGYGRKHFPDTDIIKTEINCAASGVSYYYPGEKNIIDIGGEDIKIIQCDENNHVKNFYMNDKCAAGTGAFLTEIGERADINVSEMSSLAAHSDYDKELNSFCTVFAKTEIMNWIFDGMPVQDIARGIYNSISNKVAKLKLSPGLPTFIVGGVISYHPYLKNLLGKKLDLEIQTVEAPQYIVSLGAAQIAGKYWKKLNHNTKIKEAKIDEKSSAGLE